MLAIACRCFQDLCDTPSYVGLQRGQRYVKFRENTLGSRDTA